MKIIRFSKYCFSMTCVDIKGNIVYTHRKEISTFFFHNNGHQTTGRTEKAFSGVSISIYSDSFYRRKWDRETNDRVNALYVKDGSRRVDTEAWGLLSTARQRDISQGPHLFWEEQRTTDVQVLLKEAVLQKQEKERGNNAVKFYVVKLPPSIL